MNHVRHILFLLILLAGMAQAVIADPTPREHVLGTGHDTITAVIHHVHVQDVEPSEYESDVDPDVTLAHTGNSDRVTKARTTDHTDFETPAPDPERPIFLVVQSFLI